jgi:hypothetical protein
VQRLGVREGVHGRLAMRVTYRVQPPACAALFGLAAPAKALTAIAAAGSTAYG